MVREAGRTVRWSRRRVGHGHLIDCYGPQHWDLALARVLPLCVAGAPETEILWYVYYYLSNVHEREQWTSPIVYGVNWCHPLLQKFMLACLPAGLQGIHRLERRPSI